MFQSTSAIREITIQDNIRLLEDECFKGSPIRKIILDNDVPNSIGVGDGLLVGRQADIYVRKENVAAYQTSYNWAKYATRIKAIV